MSFCFPMAIYPQLALASLSSHRFGLGLLLRLGQRDLLRLRQLDLLLRLRRK
ncbi:MAG: hypothetical protein AAF152_07820 [Cyanobacteria bacterium P01_A01_bin.114]